VAGWANAGYDASGIPHSATTGSGAGGLTGYPHPVTGQRMGMPPYTAASSTAPGSMSSNNPLSSNNPNTASYGSYMNSNSVSALSLHHVAAPALSPTPSLGGQALSSSISTLSGGRKRARTVMGACRSRIGRGGRVLIDK
jgi:hypothetical protein